MEKSTGLFHAAFSPNPWSLFKPPVLRPLFATADTRPPPSWRHCSGYASRSCEAGPPQKPPSWHRPPMFAAPVAVRASFLGIQRALSLWLRCSYLRAWAHTPTPADPVSLASWLKSQVARPPRTLWTLELPRFVRVRLARKNAKDTGGIFLASRTLTSPPKSVWPLAVAVSRWAYRLALSPNEPRPGAALCPPSARTARPQRPIGMHPRKFDRAP